MHNELMSALDLLVAAILGMLLGINRLLKHKLAGVKTHGLVSLGAALAIVIINRSSPGHYEAISRVMQGVVTGMGFIGAGVILHFDGSRRVEGLTTAASLWISAIIGLACGNGHLFLAIFALLLTLLLLTVGLRLEIMIQTPQDKDDV